MELIKRKSSKGKYYDDSRNLLKQERKEEEDMFQEPDPVEPMPVEPVVAAPVQRYKRKQLDTSLLDVEHEIPVIETCYFGSCPKCKPWQDNWSVWCHQIPSVRLPSVRLKPARIEPLLKALEYIARLGLT